jgi:hypothetical protein
MYEEDTFRLVPNYATATVSNEVFILDILSFDLINSILIHKFSILIIIFYFHNKIYLFIMKI